MSDCSKIRRKPQFTLAPTFSTEKSTARMQSKSFLVYIFLLAVTFCQAQTYQATPRTFFTPPQSGQVNPNNDCDGFWEFLPPGYDPNGTKLYPLIIYMHGGGGQGTQTGSLDDLMRIVTVGDPPADDWWAVQLPTRIYKSIINAPNNPFPTSFTVAGETYSFVVMALHCDFIGKAEDVSDYLDYFLANYKIDPNRVFVTGESIGGSRTWYVGGKSTPAFGKITAIVPIAGGADGQFACCTQRNKDTPCPGVCTGTVFNEMVANFAANPNKPRIYAIHGDQDFNLVFGQDYYNAIKAMNPSHPATLHIYPNTFHEAWLRIYDPAIRDLNNGTQSLYEWFLTQAVSILPVTLTRFSATVRGNTVDLTWSTSSESNSSHFVVERSSNGRDYKEIGRVQSNGNSSVTRNYSFRDEAPLTGHNYYRLKMVDKDASFEYSGVEKISLNSSNTEFTFGPNPVKSNAQIRITGLQKTKLNVAIRDLSGKQIRSFSYAKTAFVFTQDLDLSSLPAGQYIMTITGDDIRFNQRIIKQ